jgi:prepilin-type N-terminal cleavage/methylation domain-containing protein
MKGGNFLKKRIELIMKNKNDHVCRQSGFTLFELLVSISIIAVLTAVAVVSFGGLNKKTRDARRTSDLEKLRVALEEAKQIGTTYPSNLLSLTGPSGFLDKLPKDPKTGSTYPYIRATNYTYAIGTSMEDLGSTNVGTTLISGVNCNYKVINP